MTFGEFLQQVFEWVYEFWPLRIVNAWEQGVRLRSGNPTKLLTSENGILGSGVHGFWPLLGEIHTEDANVRVIETSWQSLETRDGKPVSFSLAARYRVRDLVKLYVNVHEPDETIQNHLSACAAQVIVGLDLVDLDDKLALGVQREARKRLNEWGVGLLDVALFNRVEAAALRLMSE